VNRRSGNEHPYQVTGAIEKPDSGNAPSKLAIAGRYLLDTQVLDALETTDSPRHGELQLTDAIAAVAEQGGPVWARPIPVPRVDLGTWEAYEAAVVQRLRRGATKV
jgi:UTP--glucose-1-phosphate uridylyltransferase